jgi:hypothetical protein
MVSVAMVKGSVTMIEKCKICGKTPSIADVGGNIPCWEITCCGQAIYSSDRESAEVGWFKMQGEVIKNDS